MLRIPAVVGIQVFFGAPAGGALGVVGGGVVMGALAGVIAILLSSFQSVINLDDKY
jgi:uncharacterized membrane protein